MMFDNVEFVNPEFFWLLLLLPIAAVWYFFKRKKQTASLKISSIKGFKGSTSILTKLKPMLFVMRLLALAALITAMARPQREDISTRTKTTRGIDIVMAIDVSSSMLARDLKPNRLVGVKKVPSDVSKERVTDRIGLGVYSGESYTKTPITSDKSMVLQALNGITYGQVQDGTGIGMGLANALNRIKDSKAKSKVL